VSAPDAHTGTGPRPASGLSIAGHVQRGGFRLDVALAVAPGEVVAVVGPNGSGKSTFLRALAGLEPLASGTLHLDGALLEGEPGTRTPPEDRCLGLVLQEPLLFPHLSARDNVAFPLRARAWRRPAARAEADRWLGLVGVVPELAARRPRALSGGQQQRVALARALIGDPRLLLLDEPLAAVDVEARAELRALVRERISAFTGVTLLVTHDPLEALALADRLVVLDAGRVRQDAPPGEVAAAPQTTYVATLLGLNLLCGNASAGTATVADARVPSALTGPVLAAVRPAALIFDHTGTTIGSYRVDALEPTPTGVRVLLGGLLAETTAADVTRLGLAPGQQVTVGVTEELLPYPTCRVGPTDPWPSDVTGDELLGDPVRDVSWVRSRQPQDDVREAGVDGRPDRAPGGAGIVVGDTQVDRAPDRGGVATDVSAVAVQQGAAGDDVVDVAAGDVPDVRVLRDDAQRRHGAAADHHRRAGALEGLGVAEGPGEVDVPPVEVEGLVLGPEPPDDRARLVEAAYGVIDVEEGQPVRGVLTPGQQGTGA